VSRRHRKRRYDRSVFRSIHTQFFFRSDLETAESGIERLEDMTKVSHLNASLHGTKEGAVEFAN
jgi:hypothetical protein